MSTLRRTPAGDSPPERARRPMRFTATVGGILLFVVALIAFLTWQNESFGSTDGGHVAVVRR